MFKDGLLKGQHILVTGGGTGLGKVMAERYLELGADIAICGRRKAVLDETAQDMMDSHGGHVSTHACDIRVPNAVEEMVEEVWSRAPLTGLVNNAAGNFISRSEDLSPRGFDAIVNIVLHGTWYVTSAVGKRWLENKLPGSVISIVASYAWTSGPFVMPSAAAKAGVIAMTRALAVEWGNRGIRLNALSPGAFPTEGASARLNPNRALGRQTDGQYRNVPMGRSGDMAELANLAVFLMAGGVDYLTGETIGIDGASSLTRPGYAERAALTDDDWARIRGQIQSVNERDRAQRAV